MYACQISKVLPAAGTVHTHKNQRFTCKQEKVLEKAILRDGWSLMSVLLRVLLLAHWLVFVPEEQRKELTLLSTSGRLMMCSKLFSVAVHCSPLSSVNKTDNHTCRTILSPHYYHHSFFSFNYLKQGGLLAFQKKFHSHERLKRMLFIRTKHNMWILGVSPKG